MRLIPREDGKGRVPAVEVMITTPYVQDCIPDRDKTVLIRDAIAAGVSQYGMQTFDQSHLSSVQEGLISFEQGLRYSTSPDNFRLRVQGIQSTWTSPWRRWRSRSTGAARPRPREGRRPR